LDLNTSRRLPLMVQVNMVVPITHLRTDLKWYSIDIYSCNICFSTLTTNGSHYKN
jgi:hypothetical protein